MFVQKARTISWNDSLMSAMLKNVPATPPLLAKTKMMQERDDEDGRGPPHRDEGLLAPAGGDPTGGDELVLGEQGRAARRALANARMAGTHA